jgi:uncharacterized membrane protein YbhN (UPF0104 family)
MSFRSWLSVITLLLISLIVFFSRHELFRAWELLRHVNIWILFLLLPGQLLVYYAGGEMMFSYLRAKKSIEAVKPLTLARMSLEMNFVNHILPSGGVSGISYMSWRLGKFGVLSSRATMAQVVRYTMSFASFIFLLSLAVLAVTIDGNINRWIILVSSTLVGGMIGIVLAGIYLLSSHDRMKSFSRWLARVINKIVANVTLHKVMNVVDKKILIRPFLWGIVFNTADVSLFLITFWALGHPIDPAPILIAYGVAAFAGFLVVTPGGAGAYEAVMVVFLTAAGLEQGTAIAGIVLTRVILLLGTIGFGYLFYQHALVRYGKDKSAPL